MTLTEKLDRLPPCICRLLAQKDGVLRTDREMVADLGVDRHTFYAMCKRKTWASFKVSEVDAFLRACGLRWSAQRKQRQRLQLAAKNGLDGIRRLHHLQRATEQRAARVSLLLRRTEELLRNSHGI